MTNTASDWCGNVSRGAELRPKLKGCAPAAAEGKQSRDAQLVKSASTDYRSTRHSARLQLNNNTLGAHFDFKVSTF